jgi:hypothetical protein
VAHRHAACPSDAGVIAVKVRGKQARLTVMRDQLERQAPGWLREWAVQLEEQRCLAPGEGMKLAGRIAESVPLDSRTAFTLLYSNELQSGELELSAYGRLRVVSPVWREAGVGLMAEAPYKITGDDHSLTVTAKSTDNLLGYETTVYALQPKDKQIGYTIKPLYTDRHINGKVERRAGPATTPFRFPEDTAFYRLFYKSWRNEFTPLAVGARTPVELERRIKLLEANAASASCDTLDGIMCIPIPKELGVTSLVAVTANGAEVLVARGVTVFNAIRTAGEDKPNNVLTNLKVYKQWNGRMIAVAFNPADEAILNLVLKGGEAISWR